MLPETYLDPCTGVSLCNSDPIVMRFYFCTTIRKYNNNNNNSMKVSLNHRSFDRDFSQWRKSGKSCCLFTVMFGYLVIQCTLTENKSLSNIATVINVQDQSVYQR